MASIDLTRDELQEVKGALEQIDIEYGLSVGRPLVPPRLLTDADKAALRAATDAAQQRGQDLLRKIDAALDTA